MISLTILLLPVLAAVVVLVAGRSARYSRRIAGAAIAVQLALLVVALLRFPMDQVRDAVSKGMVPPPADPLFIPLGTLDAASVSFSLSFSFGLDPLSLPFLFLVCLLSGGAVFLPPVAGSRLRFACPLLLMLNAFLVGVFVSLDGLSAALCTGGFLMGAVALPFLPGGKEDGARRFLPAAFGGTMLLCVTLMALSSGTEVQGSTGEYRARTFSLPALANRSAEDFRADLALYAESGVEPPGDTSDQVLFALLLCLCSGLMLIVPLHASVHDLAEAAAGPPAPLLSFLFPLLGIVLLVRFPLALFPESGAQPIVPLLLAGAGGLTAVYGGLVALGERNSGRALRYVVTAWSGTALVFFAFFDALHIGAALFLLFAGILCAAVLHLLINRIESGMAEEERGRMRGLLRSAPRWSLLFAAPALLLVLLPIYPGLLPVRQMNSLPLPPELSGGAGITGIGWMIPGLAGGVLAAFAVAKIAIRLLFGDAPVAVGRFRPADLRRGELGAGGVLILALVVLTVALLPFFMPAGEMIRRLVSLTGSVPT